LREQTDRALKLLDDVVNSELNDIPQTREITPPIVENRKSRPIVYQFIPPDKMKPTEKQASKPQNKENQLDQPPKQRLKFQSTENLTEMKPHDHLEQQTHVNYKPSGKQIGNQMSRSKQLEIIREDLNRNKLAAAYDSNVNNSSGSHDNNNEVASFFKKNSNKAKTKSQCKKSNSSVSNLVTISNINNQNIKANNRNSFFLSSNQSIEEKAAAYGIRNGVLSRLGNYQPQWMSTSALSEVNQNKTQFLDNYCAISQAPQSVHPHNNYRHESQLSRKLRHSESARTNRDANINMTPENIHHNNMSNNNNRGHVVKSLKQTLSFLRREVMRETPNETMDYTQHRQESFQGGRFVLKPAKSNHDISSFYFKDLAPQSNLNRRFFECGKKMTIYKSEPSLLAPQPPPQPMNPTHNYHFNDFFY
jgi:hypothetical protein